MYCHYYHCCCCYCCCWGETTPSKTIAEPHTLMCWLTFTHACLHAHTQTHTQQWTWYRLHLWDRVRASVCTNVHLYGTKFPHKSLLMMPQLLSCFCWTAVARVCAGCGRWAKCRLWPLSQTSHVFAFRTALSWSADETSGVTVTMSGCNRSTPCSHWMRWSNLTNELRGWLFAKEMNTPGMLKTNNWNPY